MANSSETEKAQKIGGFYLENLLRLIGPGIKQYKEHPYRRVSDYRDDNRMQESIEKHTGFHIPEDFNWQIGFGRLFWIPVIRQGDLPLVYFGYENPTKTPTVQSALGTIEISRKVVTTDTAEPIRRKYIPTLLRVAGAMQPVDLNEDKRVVAAT